MVGGVEVEEEILSKRSGLLFAKQNVKTQWDVKSYCECEAALILSRASPST